MTLLHLGQELSICLQFTNQVRWVSFHVFLFLPPLFLSRLVFLFSFYVYLAEEQGGNPKAWVGKLGAGSAPITT